MTASRQDSATRPLTPDQGGVGRPRHLSVTRDPAPISTSNVRPISIIGPLSPVDTNGSFVFDRVIRRGKVERRVKKKGAWKSSWKPAYLVLRPNLLSVYKDQDETELRASITLSDVTAVAPVKKSHHDNVFGIFTSAKNHHFAGLSARATSEWITTLRLEARTDTQEDLEPPNAGFRQAEPQGYDTTDISADEEPEAPRSPEVPMWKVKSQKSRVMPQAGTDIRKASTLAPYPSGTESFATSQSDFSDGFGTSVPGSKGYLSASLPMQASPLTPIPDEVPSSARPTLDRNDSYFFDTGMTPVHAQPISKSVPRQVPTTQDDRDSRVVRQGHLRVLKITSGMKQWRSVWVVLRTQSLAIYKSNNEYAPLVVIPTYSIVEAAEIDRKNKQNCFQVISEEKTYRLQTETEGELESWLGAFKSVVMRQEAERTRSRGPSVSLQANEQAVGGNRDQKPLQPLGGRDGSVIGGIAAQMNRVSISDAAGQQQAKRLSNPPPPASVSASAGAGVTVNTQVTSPV